MFYLSNIDVVKGCGLHLVAEKRAKESKNPIWIQTRFCDDLETILGVILGAKIVQKSMSLGGAAPCGVIPGGGGVTPFKTFHTNSDDEEGFFEKV